VMPGKPTGRDQSRHRQRRFRSGGDGGWLPNPPTPASSYESSARMRAQCDWRSPVPASVAEADNSARCQRRLKIVKIPHFAGRKFSTGVDRGPISKDDRARHRPRSEAFTTAVRGRVGTERVASATVERVTHSPDQGTLPLASEIIHLSLRAVRRDGEPDPSDGERRPTSTVCNEPGAAVSIFQ
jgi:hypothetical protein